MPQRWQWSRNAAGDEKPYTITFLDHGYLLWNEQKNYGWWSYIYSSELDVGYFFIEFSAGKGTPKRHVFEHMEENYEASLANRDTFAGATRESSRQAMQVIDQFASWIRGR